MADKQPSGMMAVSASEAIVLPYLEQVTNQSPESKLSVACFNSPKNVTVAGDPMLLDMLKTRLDGAGILCRLLQVGVAYHSPSMQAVASEYASFLDDLDQSAIDQSYCTMISSVTGGIAQRSDLTKAHYWVQNMVQKVRFSEAMQKICLSKSRRLRKKLDGSHRDIVTVDDIVEVGPHAALKRPIMEILESTIGTKAVTYSSVLVRDQSALRTALASVGKLYQRGHHVEISKVNRHVELSEVQVLTDLPEYPFDRSRTYWHESRRSREFRLRRYPRMDLLGMHSPDSNPLDSKWCNVINSSELPWVEDHKVQGVLVYPAAGMLVMAIEALTSLTSDSQIAGIELRDVSFYRPLKLSRTSAGVETQFTIHSVQAAQDKSNSHSEFRLYVREDDSWVDICCGTILLELEKTIDSQHSWYTGKNRFELARNAVKRTSEECSHSISSNRVYEFLRSSGYEYGSAFQPLVEIQYSGTRTAVGTVKVFKQDADCLQAHVIHPTTLDGIFQMVFAALLESNSQEVPTVVPTRLGKMWISRAGLNFNNSHAIRTSARVDSRTKNTLNASVVGFSETSLASVLVEGLEMTTLSSTQALKTSEYNAHLCFNIDWRPDLDLASANEISSYCQKFRPEEEPVSFDEDLTDLLYAFAAITSEAIPTSKVDPAHQRYFKWMQRHLSTRGDTSLHRAKLDVERLKDRIANANPMGAMFVKVGSRLPQLISGDLNPLDVLFEGEGLESFYTYLNERAQCYDALKRYMDCLVHKFPGMTIMEIGAGTGATTKLLLETASYGEQSDHSGSSIGPLQYARYDFTDISPAFFSSAKDKWKNHPRMQFRIFNVANDAFSQGFHEPYDLIIAANVSRDFAEMLVKAET